MKEQIVQTLKAHNVKIVSKTISKGAEPDGPGRTSIFKMFQKLRIKEHIFDIYKNHILC